MKKLLVILLLLVISCKKPDYSETFVLTIEYKSGVISYFTNARFYFEEFKEEDVLRIVCDRGNYSIWRSDIIRYRLR
jgi:hypothetical protein